MLVVSHRRHQVTVVGREGGAWTQCEYRAGEEVVLENPRLSFAIDELYDGIELDKNT